MSPPHNQSLQLRQRNPRRKSRPCNPPQRPQPCPPANLAPDRHPTRPPACASPPTHQRPDPSHCRQPLAPPLPYPPTPCKAPPPAKPPLSARPPSSFRRSSAARRRQTGRCSGATHGAGVRGSSRQQRGRRSRGFCLRALTAASARCFPAATRKVPHSTRGRCSPLRRPCQVTGGKQKWLVVRVGELPSAQAAPTLMTNPIPVHFPAHPMTVRRGRRAHPPARSTPSAAAAAPGPCRRAILPVRAVRVSTCRVQPTCTCRPVAKPRRRWRRSPKPAAWMMTAARDPTRMRLLARRTAAPFASRLWRRIAVGGTQATLW